MSEILTQAGTVLRVLRNADGTFTAQCGKRVASFATMQEAIGWVCTVRDGAEMRGENK